MMAKARRSFTDDERARYAGVAPATTNRGDTPFKAASLCARKCMIGSAIAGINELATP